MTLLAVLCVPPCVQAQDRATSPASPVYEQVLTSDAKEGGPGRDSLWNGALIGSAVGASLGVVLAATDDCRGQGVGPCFSNAEGVLFVGGVMGAMGFGVGAAIDAMLHRDPQVSAGARRGASWIAAPLLRRDRIGVVVSTEWQGH
jgi:hypothetical protein